MPRRLNIWALSDWYPCENTLFAVELSSRKVQFAVSVTCNIYPGAIAQLARAPALQAGGPGFESPLLHQIAYYRQGRLAQLVR